MTPDLLPTQAEHRARLVLLDDALDQDEPDPAEDAVAWPDVDHLAGAAA